MLSVSAPAIDLRGAWLMETDLREDDLCGARLAGRLPVANGSLLSAQEAKEIDCFIRLPLEQSQHAKVRHRN